MRFALPKLIQVGIIVLLLGGASARATPLYTFNLVPLNGMVSGAPGTTVGWGYSITNNSTDYLVTTAINSDIFANGMPFALFDFPAIAPNNTVTEAFVANISGLYQLTWDNNAPVGLSNAGLFVLSADFYSGDPLAGGTFLSSADDTFAAYSATVMTPSSVPEPSSFALLSLGLALAAWFALRPGYKRKQV